MQNQGLDVASLYAALDSKRKSSNKSWRQVAKEAGISASTITRMKSNKRPDVDGFAALVQWLGMKADSFLPTATPRRKSEADPAAEIMTFLRARKELEPASVEAIQDVIQAACKLLQKRSK
jgi:transcriptional regulator with XRE-family HTH domain